MTDVIDEAVDLPDEEADALLPTEPQRPVFCYQCGGPTGHYAPTGLAARDNARLCDSCQNLPPRWRLDHGEGMFIRRQDGTVADRPMEFPDTPAEAPERHDSTNWHCTNCGSHYVRVTQRLRRMTYIAVGIEDEVFDEAEDDYIYHWAPDPNAVFENGRMVIQANANGTPAHVDYEVCCDECGEPATHPYRIRQRNLVDADVN